MSKRKSTLGEAEENVMEKTVNEAVEALDSEKASDLPKGLPEPVIPDAPPADVPHAETGISDPILVLRLAYLQEKVTRLNAQESGYNMLFESRRRQVEEERTTTMTQVRRDKVIAEGEYRAIQRNIETKHNISLKDFTFDPDTGKLNRITESSGEPT